MSLTTFSAFYYDHNVDSLQSSLDFSEGGPELQASLNIGDYTLTELLTEVKQQMDNVGGQDYIVQVDRFTRIVTISAPGNFELLVDSGTRGDSSVFTLLGFTGSDRTGANSYTGNLPCGEAYFPQFILQDHIATANYREFIDPAVSISSAGEVEVVRFGDQRFLQCNIRFATDIPQPGAGPIENNPSGVADLRQFMEFITEKRKIEYMADRSNPETFEKLRLEATPEGDSGTSFRLKELYNQGAPGYFDTGVLRFRKVN